MAQHTVTVLTDDVHGDDAPATQSITFSLDGVGYVIDLDDGNAARLREDFSTWTFHARAGSRGRARRTHGGGGRPVSATPGQNAAVRQWARGNGQEVSDRGRISAMVLQAYDQAHR